MAAGAFTLSTSTHGRWCLQRFPWRRLPNNSGACYSRDVRRDRRMAVGTRHVSLITHGRCCLQRGPQVLSTRDRGARSLLSRRVADHTSSLSSQRISPGLRGSHCMDFRCGRMLRMAREAWTSMLTKCVPCIGNALYRGLASRLVVVTRARVEGAGLSQRCKCA